MTQWLPIKTAPKDGTKIVIWNKHYRFCLIARWVKSDPGESVDAEGWWFEDKVMVEMGFIGWKPDIRTQLMPTHWVPLPSSPKEDKP